MTVAPSVSPSFYIRTRHAPRVRRHPAGSLLAVLLLFCSFVSHAAEAPPDSVEREDVKMIAAPYVSGNTDVGITLGLGFGATRNPDVYTVSSAEYSSNGRISLVLEGEMWIKKFIYAGKVSFGYSPRDAYPTRDVDPKPLAEAIDQRLDIKLSALRPLSRQLELGPSVWIETSKGIDPTGPDDEPLPIELFPRFISGGLAMAGGRVRWHTTSTVRPTDGHILDLIVQGGTSWWKGWDERSPRPDATVQFLAAHAEPLHSRLRLYVRGDTRLQLETPPPVRNYNGGDKKVRGQPNRRETGRRIITGRSQLHWTALDNWEWPLRSLNSLWDVFPVYPIDVELVPFYDVGWLADPDFGWHRTRHGVGAGLHIVIPPELVLRMDVGWSPYAQGPRVYFTVGETI